MFEDGLIAFCSHITQSMQWPRTHKVLSPALLGQVPALLYASLVPLLLELHGVEDAAVSASGTTASKASGGGTPGAEKFVDFRRLEDVMGSVRATIRAHVALTHKSEQLQRHIRIYADLLTATLLLARSSTPSKAERNLFRTHVQAAGRHLGWDFRGLLGTGVTDEQVVYGVMGPYIRHQCAHDHPLYR